MTDTTPACRLWRTLAPRPGGSRDFSAAAMPRMTYFASIVPHERRTEPGAVRTGFCVRNHLGKVHAISSCNDEAGTEVVHADITTWVTPRV
jgi:hypothetical protein